MKKILLVTVLSLGGSLVFAAGGQNQAQQTVFDVSGSPVGTVVPVPEGCEILIPQSGKAVYIMCTDSADN